MLKKTISYVDFDGIERKEDFFFNLTKAEILDWDLSVYGGMTRAIDQIINTKDQVKLINVFKEIIDKAYGIKTPDGRGFVKTPEVLSEFKATNAYSELYMELITNSKAAAAFVNGIVPKEVRDEAAKENPNIIEMNN